MRILQTLDATKTQGEAGVAPLLHDVAERAGTRSMVVVISDLFDRADALAEALHHLRHRRHEVLLMQVIADDELTFPFRTWSLFENLERPDDRLRLDPAYARTTYLENLAAHQQAIVEAAHKLKISHVLLNTRKPFDAALANYLAARVGWK
jgi:uncharacterized protein (DUF58 family)